MKKSWLIGSVLILTLIIALTGCGGRNEQTSTGSRPDPTPVDGATEYFVIQGNETGIGTDPTLWRDHTGSGTTKIFTYSFSKINNFLDFYSKRAQDQVAGGSAFTQLWTPGESGLGNFLANSTMNYISMSFSLSAPSGAQAYETAFALGNYGTTRYAFNGELIRFRRNGTIVCGGTPLSGSGAQQMELVDGTGQEVGTYQYGKWYTVTFAIDTSLTGIATVVATIFDGDSGAKLYESPSYVIVTDHSINSLRWMTYTGYSGKTNDDFHIYLHYIKAYHFMD